MSRVGRLCGQLQLLIRESHLEQRHRSQLKLSRMLLNKPRSHHLEDNNNNNNSQIILTSGCNNKAMLKINNSRESADQEASPRTSWREPDLLRELQLRAVDLAAGMEVIRGHPLLTEVRWRRCG